MGGWLPVLVWNENPLIGRRNHSEQRTPQKSVTTYLNLSCNTFGQPWSYIFYPINLRQYLHWTLPHHTYSLGSHFTASSIFHTLWRKNLYHHRVITKALFPYRWMLVGPCICSFLYVWIPLLNFCLRPYHTLIQHIWLWDCLKLLSISWLVSPPHVTFLSFCKSFYLLPGGNYFWVHQTFYLPWPHSVIQPRLTPFYYIFHKLGSFIYLILQDLVSVLSDIIEYHCPFYTVTEEAFHLWEHNRKNGW